MEISESWGRGAFERLLQFKVRPGPTTPESPSRLTYRLPWAVTRALGLRGRRFRGSGVGAQFERRKEFE